MMGYLRRRLGRQECTLNDDLDEMWQDNVVFVAVDLLNQWQF